MSSTAVATTASPISETSSSSSSTVPSISAQVSSGSSPSSVVTTTSSSSDPPTTSAQGSSTQQATLSTAAPSNTTQAQTPSSTIASSEPSTTISSTSISTVPSTSDAPSTTSSSSSSPSPSQSSSPAGNDIPLTTVLESTTVFVTSTNSQGQVVTSAPPVVTEVIPTTGSGGVATTVTQAIVNPTLASYDSASGGSSFFNDTGAVVGVFVVVGLASASILMWMLFAVRRRQRMRRIEQDTVIEAAVTAAGFNRAPLDDGDERDSPTSPNTRQYSRGMDQRVNLSFGGSGSLPTSSRLSEPLDDSAQGGANSHREFRVVHRTRSHPEGYIPARTTSPPSGRFTDDLGSSRDRKSSYGHTPTYSAGSFEPLLANYAQNTAEQDTPSMEASQNPSSQRPDSGHGPNEYSSNRTPEDASRRRSSSDGSVLQEEEFAHYVLMVRNIPDDQSQHSE